VGTNIMPQQRCLMCERAIERLYDVPRVTVERVQVLGLLQRRWSGPVKSVARNLRQLTRDQRRLQLDIRRIVDDREAMLARAREVAALDGPRDYVARLQKLSGRTVRWSALLPPWQPKREHVQFRDVQIPGSPCQDNGPERWVVGLHTTHWRGDLRARVDVELVWQCRQFGETGGTLARVWLRGHLNRAS
jgi:hypothetical protein